MNKIKLRNLNDDDVDFIMENWADGHEFSEYHFKKSRIEILNLINIWNKKLYKGKYFEMYLIEVTNRRVGLLSLYQHTNNSVSIGISIESDFQNKGISTECVKIIVSKLQQSKWKYLLSQCRTDNLPSIAMHKKCGFEIIDKIITNKSHEVFIWKMSLKTFNEDGI